ncbi:uncharacterized protein LOC119374192 [Rhipicephalus sanguineus]|uniref:uncharacterized protein LOC119374192 n=1 Tax=Rhipicephalus sanguineus TaxID=34632 RepID=UPI001895B7E1|nr:uncharacterized protein LOC119374192 [Rhipicephalus sanguineus]
MPGHCCVPRCRGNYDGGESVRVFTFPSDPARRTQWIKAIHRADFTPGKRSVVCERHFKPSDMVDSTSYVDAKTGKVIEAKLKLTRLRPDAVPSILPNCPAYFSAPASSTSREAPHEKKARREAAFLQDAIKMSIETHHEEEQNNKIDTFQALLNCLPCIKVSKFWAVIPQHDCVLFLNLTVDDAPAIRKSVKITEDLSLRLFFQDVEVTKVDGIDVPNTVNDIRCLTNLLEAVEGFDETPALNSEDKTSGILKLVVSLLEDAMNRELQDEERKDSCTFLRDNPKILTASFKTLRDLHLKEQDQLVKAAPMLSVKALNPSSMERQNVKLALKVFNPSTTAAVETYAQRYDLQHAPGTAEFLRIVETWWKIINVKSPSKGRRLRYVLQTPVAQILCPQVEFLRNIVQWLDVWEQLKFDNGIFTRETHSAFRPTTETLLKLITYCLEDLRFDYVLLGKFQRLFGGKIWQV